VTTPTPQANPILARAAPDVDYGLGSGVARLHGVAGRRPSRAYWGCQSVGFGLYYVVTVAQLYSVPELQRQGPRFWLEPLLAVLSGVVLTHALRHVAIRRGWGGLSPRALALRVLIATFLLAGAHVGILAGVEFGYYGDQPDEPGVVVAFALMRWSMVFFIWQAIYFGIGLMRQRQHSEIERLQLVQALQTAELRWLKSQLNPHFLFNALNTVRSLIEDDPARARDAVTLLARSLRYGLAAGHVESVALGRELEMVDAYLGLEALRLAERLRFERAIAQDATSAMLPVMLLQTLVENAIKHGIAQLPAGGTLRVTAERDEGMLLLCVENPRPRAPASAGSCPRGIGLANAAERLRLLFGVRASLQLDLSAPERSIAIARIPQPP
jgi:hypothetical protein